MAKKIINIGKSTKGDGDPLRTAFPKVNDNQMNFTAVFYRYYKFWY